jgi:TfoX/Sxy family transcriptional regulator of competence genes
MAYDLELANRIRALMSKVPQLTEKAMFGGLAFLVNGNMAVAVSSKGGLLLRVEPAHTNALAKKPHAEPFEMRGKPMRGWLRVDADGVKTDKSLKAWVDLSVAFARSLPPKDKAKARPIGKMPKKAGATTKTARRRQ